MNRLTLFQTERLDVRRLDAADVDALLAVYGDQDAMKWVGDGNPLDRSMCERWVDVTERNYATRGYGMSAVELRSTGEVIGFCGLVHPDGTPIAELKYAFLRPHWGHGYATETARAMLEYGAREFGLSEILATAYSENLASHRVLQKAGMKEARRVLEDDGSTTCVFRRGFGEE